MKKWICLLLALSIILSLTACGGKPTEETIAPAQPEESNPAPAAPETNTTIEVDENLLTVDIVVPAAFFDEDPDAFDGDAYAKEMDFQSARMNEDGSVSIRMSKSRHNKLMDELGTLIDSTLAEMVGAEDTPYITAIEHSDSFDSIDLIVDRAGYEADGLFAAFLPLGIYLTAGMYQAFDGTDSPQCEITILAADTNEVLASAIYPDALEAVEEAAMEEPTASFDDAVYTDEEIVIVDNEICTMKVTDIEPNGDWGFTFHVFCENKTDTPVNFSMDYVSVNGYMCDPFWGTEVAAGKKANTSFSFSALEDLNISIVEEVAFTLRVSNADDWMTDPYLEDSFAIYPTGLSAAEVIYADRETVAGETIVIDDDTCTFAILSADPDGFWGYTLRCYLENSTDAYLMFSWDDVSVNSFMIDPYWGTVIAPGKRGYSEISFSREELAANGIESITEIAYTLRASDQNDWMADPLVSTTFVYTPSN